MKRKFVNFEDYRKVVEPDTKISFGTISPFQTLTNPRSTLFIAWAGNLSPVSGTSIAMGTIDFCRLDNDPQPLNFDKYVFYSTGTPSILEVVGPKKPNYHWSSKLPGHLQDNAPNWVKEIIKSPPDLALL